MDKGLDPVKSIILDIKRRKIVFFVKQGLDSFLGEIINALSDEYEVKKIIVTQYNQINDGMEWADICWFEWCDELAIYGSKLDIAKEKKIVCRLHSYEAFTDYVTQVNWENVNKLICISKYIKNIIVVKTNIRSEKAVVIQNGIDIDKYSYKERTTGFNVAYVGYINYKKGPMLLLHTFKAIYEKDNRYKLYIAGEFQDERYVLYFSQMIKEMGLENNVIYEGWQSELDKWLEDKNYILCTSLLESQNISVMQGMSKGIKPIIHNFVGAKEIYSHKYVWNSIDDAVNMITEKNYDSQIYRKYIEDNYSLDKQLESTNQLIKNILNKNDNSFDYNSYCNNRLNSKFDIEGVGYLGLGKIYNKLLYKNRLEILNYVFKTIFGEIKKINVLELGPGTGIFTDLFYSKGVKKYSAIDIAARSVNELSKKYQEYNFINGDISNNCFYKEKYDLVFVADVLLHLTNEANYKTTINNISKSLTNKGYCIFLEPISVIATKSESPHCVIRDVKYLEDILDQNGLELVDMIPVAFLMNYPFDRSLIEPKDDAIFKLFNLIQKIYNDNQINEEEKNIIGELILNQERQCLINYNFGLSEKLLIIRKKTEIAPCAKLKLSDIWNYNELVMEEDRIKQEIKNKFKIDNCDYFKLLDNLLLEVSMKNNKKIESSVSINYLIEKFNEFTSYDSNIFDNYNFKTGKIMMGRKEKITDSLEIMEFLIKNNENKILAINNIWYDTKSNAMLIPDLMLRSKNNEFIQRFIKEIFEYKIEYINNIAGFVIDKNIIKNISENEEAYIWERGIPASQFMPAIGYLKIAERYIFAGTFIKPTDKVLEAPSGFGYGAAYFSKLCLSVEAVDIANENIVFAKNAYEFNNVNWMQEDITKLTFKNGKFDIYVSYEVFEHLHLELVETYLLEAKRVLKKEGKFIISTPNREMRNNIHNPFHIKEYNYHEFSSLLEKYFRKIEYYSVSSYKVEKGMKNTAFEMIAICTKTD